MTAETMHQLHSSLTVSTNHYLQIQLGKERGTALGLVDTLAYIKIILNFLFNAMIHTGAKSELYIYIYIHLLFSLFFCLHSSVQQPSESPCSCTHRGSFLL